MSTFSQSEQVRLHINGCYGKTTQTSDVLIYGQLWLGNEVLSPEQLKAALVDAVAKSQLSHFIAGLNGFFSVICLIEQQLLCFTDKVRSRPLFYMQHKHQLIISDQAAFIATEYAGSAEAISVTEQEFIHTGFVTGQDTLHPAVKQVQAAQLLQADLSSGNIATLFYYCFIPRNHVDPLPDIKYWQHRLHTVTESVVSRLIKYANGRQIVVPLSGGYDSRALALYLRQAGYNNVVCFTFGRKGSAEVTLSNRVASELGYSWRCISYKRRMWQDLLQQPEFSAYLDFVHGLVSVPNVQVFPAVKQLVAEGYIAADAVIAPGHTSAFFSGDINVDNEPDEMTLKQYALRSVLARHYQNSRHELSEELLFKVKQQIAEIYQQAKLQGIQNCNSIAEAWNYRERQAKFIINSNRYYDFFGLDWWMPFWDSEFMAFWQQAPYNLRKKKCLWTGFVEQEMLHFSKADRPYGHASERKYSWLTRCYSWFNYFLDDNHLHALVPFKRWLLFKLRLTTYSGTVFGCLAEYCLRGYQKRFGMKSGK